MQVRNNLLRSRRIAQNMSRTDVARAAGIGIYLYCKMEKLEVSPLRSVVMRQCREPQCDASANYPSNMLCKRHSRSVGSSKWIMKRTPVDWTPAAVALASFYSCKPSDLFPGSILAVEVSKHEKEVDWEDVAPYLESSHTSRLALPPDATQEHSEMASIVQEAIESLPSDRDKKIVRLMADGATLTETAAELGVSRERARQLRIINLRRLRNPKISKSLRPYWGDEADQTLDPSCPSDDEAETSPDSKLPHSELPPELYKLPNSEWYCQSCGIANPDYNMARPTVCPGCGLICQARRPTTSPGLEPSWQCYTCGAYNFDMNHPTPCTQCNNVHWAHRATP
jgi:transcriptional regulator with XRE-family HTH domain